MGNLQIGPAVTKFVAENYGRENIVGVSQYVVMAMVVLSLTGTLALTIILNLDAQIVALFTLKDVHAAVALRLLPYIGLLCIYPFLVQTLNATLSGLGRIDLANYTQST